MLVFIDLLFEQWIRIGTAQGTFSPDTNVSRCYHLECVSHQYRCM
jgi:hypothetical protein